jgi:hypothetical protein
VRWPSNVTRHVLLTPDRGWSRDRLLERMPAMTTSRRPAPAPITRKTKAALAAVPWLAQAGTSVRGARRARSLSQAKFGYWPDRYRIWSRHSHALEKRAREAIGDPAIETIFGSVARTIRKPVWAGLGAFIERHGDDDGAERAAAIDLIDDIERDVAWAMVELRLERSGFFSMLFGWYERGRWPCAWVGRYPAGRLVVL